MKEGEDGIEIVQISDPLGNVVKVEMPYKVIKKGGIGESGFWTFYTIKYFSSNKSIIVIIYKPEFGPVAILRRDSFIYWCVLEQDHSNVVWIFFDIGKETGDGMVAMFLKPMDSLLHNPDWKFIPKEYMRPDLCWEE